MRFPEKRLNFDFKKHYTTFLNMAGFQNKVVEIRGKHEFGFLGGNFWSHDGFPLTFVMGPWIDWPLAEHFPSNPKSVDTPLDYPTRDM